MDANLTFRASCRAQVTRIVNQITDFLNGHPGPGSDGDTSGTQEELSVLLERIKLANDNLCKANESVKVLIEKDQMEKECDSVLEYEDKAMTAITRIKLRLERYQRHAASRRTGTATSASGNRSNHTEETTTRNVNSSSNDSAQIQVSVRLPKLELKKFGGNIIDWLPFWEQFRTIIHENNSLDSASKFNYLQSALTGKAAQAIAGFTPTESCYEDAIALLIDQYGDNEKIIEKCMQQLMSLEHVHSKSNIEGLRQLFNSVSSGIRSLTALNVPVSQYNIMLRSIVLRCLPSETRVNYLRQNPKCPEVNLSATNASHLDSVNGDNSHASNISNEGESLQPVILFLKTELEAMEESAELAKESKKTNSPSHRKISTAAGLLASNVNDNSCLFCKSREHNTSSCNSSVITLVQRKECLKRQGRCFRCTGKNHNSSKCKRKFLKCQRCGGRHVTSMCDPQFNARNEKEKFNTYQATAAVTEKAVNLFTPNTQRGQVLLQTAYAFVKAPGGHLSSLLRLVLDGGSQITFVREDVAKALDLCVIGTQKLSIMPFGASSLPPTRILKRVELRIRGQYGEEGVTIEAVVVPDICLDVLPAARVNDSEVRELQLADNLVSEASAAPGISLLIGADYYWNVVKNEHRRLKGNLVAIDTVLGWTLHGPSGKMSNSDKIGSLSLLVNSKIDFDERKLWSLEAIGIESPSDGTNNSFTERFMADNVKFLGDYYEVKLPWKQENITLNENKVVSLKRLKTLTMKLQREGRFEEYDRAMRAYIENDFAESVPIHSTNGRTYYMPHRAVYREDSSTTRIRVVFDASSHQTGHLSLNDNLLVGDNLNADLYAVLLNFRMGTVGLASDIEKAFLQIRLADVDRDSHRFLWYNGRQEDSIEFPSIAEFRMTRVTFGVTSSPFLLAVTIRKHLISNEDKYPEVSRILKRSFYVDDLVVSVNNIAQAEKLYNQSTELMKLAGMNLRKWKTNEKNLRIKIEDANIELNEGGFEKILGIRWWLKTDELSLDLEFSQTEGTKRNVLRTLSSVYDPLGIIGPITIKLKILFQMLWKNKAGWDDPFSGDLLKIWNRWGLDQCALNEIFIPRCVFSYEAREMDDISLHVFADASINAYGAAAYIRNVSVEGKISVNLLCSKNRLAPIKEDGNRELTLPKLELTAALLAARLQAHLRAKLSIEINDVYFWSDSQITLCWIKGSSARWKPYVRNRVIEIQNLTEGCHWRHCSSNTNPADLLTRGIAAQQLIKSPLWFQGPDYLHRNFNEWPSDIVHTYDSVHPTIVAFQISTDSTPCEHADAILAVENFSSFKKLLRVSAYILRFVNNLRNGNRRTTNVIMADELTKAEIYWIKHVQRSEYAEEIRSLKKGTTINTQSKIATLTPFLDEDDLLRVGGRLHKASLHFEDTHPIILPRNASINELIIREVHNDLFHAGISSVLCHIRQRFWLIRARQLIKRVISRCVKCKRLHGRSASEPFAPLPRERIQFRIAFESTGVDFAGPLYIKQSVESSCKVYFMLSTCAVTRAIHLELVPDLTAETCIRALKRFFARRGTPKVIFSDNAKTFKRTSKELAVLHNVVSNAELQSFSAHRGIEWRFIVERAAWWGGFWERLIKIVKDALKAAIGRSILNFDELHTVIVEIEGIVNSRPITCVEDDPGSPQPLTPAHFLTGPSATSLPELGNSFLNSLANADLVQIWRKRQAIVNKFRKRWTTEYLQQLRSAHHTPRSFSSTVKAGDVILIHEQGSPRILWKMGVVTATFPGRDNRVRACEVRLSDGTRLRRPVQLLVPLEIL